MKLQDQVCTIEQGKRLFAMGITAISANYHRQCFVNGVETFEILPFMMYHYGAWSENEYVKDCLDGNVRNICYPAFTVAEIICMMPDTTMLGIGSAQIVMYRGFNSGKYITEMPTEIIGEIDAIKTFEASNMVVSATDMLIYLLENKYTTAADCNARLTS